MNNKIYPVDIDAVSNTRALVLRCPDPRFVRPSEEFLKDLGLWPAFVLPKIGGIIDLTSHERLNVHADSFKADIRDAIDKVYEGRQLPVVCIQHQKCVGCGRGKCDNFEECLEFQTTLIREAHETLSAYQWFSEKVTSFSGYFFGLDGKVREIPLVDTTVFPRLVA